MFRLFDFTFAFIGIVVLFPLMIVIFLISIFDNGSPIFKQKRMGKDRKPFTLYKFRTMFKTTAFLPTHLINKSSVTPFGLFLRKSKLDELPQLFNVLFGSMSLVGPRPNLLNQTDLIEFRTNLGVYNVRPGITGLSQIHGIDMSNPLLLSQTDASMIKKFSIKLYFVLIFKTILGHGSGDRISYLITIIVIDIFNLFI